MEKQAEIATDFESSPDFAKLARSQNCKGIRVTEPDKVEPALRSALRANQSGIPVLVEVQIAKHDYAPHFLVLPTARFGGLGRNNSQLQNLSE